MGDVQQILYGDGKEPFLELAPMRRTLADFNTFAAIFQLRLGTNLDCSMMWALLGLNLQASQ